MSPETARTLARINQRFYREHAALFASRRERPWPGMLRVLHELPAKPGSVLDVGCGHGRFAALVREAAPGARFLGVDASLELLALARGRSDVPADAEWRRVDVLAEPEAIPRGPFDLVTLFGVIHHVPGEARRGALLRRLGERVAPGGTLALAFWTTAGDEDASRRVPWALAGVDAAELEPGDRLLRFGEDPLVNRFAHFADAAELLRVEAAPGLPCVLRFASDGAGGVSNAYFLWRRPA
jgi:SAM-dependent methyltransferase